MVGPKLNDGALLVDDDRVTTKATAKYLRGSASKVREVLNLIRGLDVRRADEVLQFTARDVAAGHPQGADECRLQRRAQRRAGPRRVVRTSPATPTKARRCAGSGRAPRAGRHGSASARATSRSSSTRLSDERLDVLQARQEAHQAAGRRRPVGTGRSRRDRVERSRTRAQALRDGGEEPDRGELPEETPAADEGAVDETEVVADEVADDVATRQHEVEDVEEARGGGRRSS